MELLVSIWHGSQFCILFCHELHNVYIDSEKKKSWIKSYNLTADFIHSFTLEILLSAAAAAAAKSLQSCPTLCNPVDGSPLGSSVPGILQERTLECVAFPSPGIKLMSPASPTLVDSLPLWHRRNNSKQHRWKSCKFYKSILFLTITNNIFPLVVRVHVPQYLPPGKCSKFDFFPPRRVFFALNFFMPTNWLF